MIFELYIGNFKEVWSLLLKRAKIKIEIDNEQKFLEFHSGRVRVCLHGGGGPQVGEVTRQSGVTCLSI